MGISGPLPRANRTAAYRRNSSRDATSARTAIRNHEWLLCASAHASGSGRTDSWPRKQYPTERSYRQSQHKAAIPCTEGSESMSTIHTLIVDNYEPFRRFVCSILGSIPDLQIIGEASEGLEAVQKAEELKPDLILLDIGLPKLGGIQAAHRISRLVPAAKILFVSQENDTDVVVAALTNGAKGYVRKQNASSELLSAVEAVLQGNRFVSEGLISQT